MRRALAILLFLLASPVVAEDGVGGIPSYSATEDGFTVKISMDELVARFVRSDELCRGGSLDEIETWEACGEREAYAIVIKGSGYCPNARHSYEPCAKP